MPITGYTDPVWAAIKALLIAEWTSTPLQFPNSDYNPDGSAEWVKVEIHGTIYAQASIGANVQANNRWDDEGVLWMYLIVQRGNVDYTNIRGAAKALANIFRGRTLLSGMLEFMDAKIDPGASNEEDGASFVVPVSIEWRHWDA